MKSLVSKILISLILGSLMSFPVYSESLFRTGVEENVYSIQPRSLFSSVRAKSIGDLVTIVLNETIASSDNLKYSTNKTSNTVDKFSNLINRILPGNVVTNALNDATGTGFNNYGGTNTVGNTSQTERKIKFTDTITAQVVQILPNGNLLVQGKKATVNAGERVNILVSGIVDPRLLDNKGSINSQSVANLQIGVTGEGNVSRSNSDGPVNKLIRYLF